MGLAETIGYGNGINKFSIRGKCIEIGFEHVDIVLETKQTFHMV